MNLDKRRLVQSLATGLLSEAVNKLVPILILVFVVRRLGADHFGFAQFSFWLIDVGIIFIVFGYHHWAAIRIGKIDQDHRRGG